MKRVAEKMPQQFRKYLSASPPQTVTSVCINSRINLIQIVSFIEADIVKVMSWGRAYIFRFKLDFLFFLVLSNPEEDEASHCGYGDDEEGTQKVGSGGGIVCTNFPYRYCDWAVLLFVAQ